jgi:FkbM family methyltransferase
MMRFLRDWARGMLRVWARTGRLHGYFYRTMERWGSRLAEAELLVSHLPDGSRVECDLRDHVQRHMFFQGVYEPVEAFLFSRLVRPGTVVVDAGANVGQYTLLAASAVGASGTVHSFEPVPRNFTRLRRHVERNGVTNVRLNPLALWHEPGELELGLPTDEVNDGSYSAGAATASAVPAVVGRAVRLDDYARENSLTGVALLKMDVEGSEWAALRGMAEVLDRDRPILLLEVNREACERLGYDPSVFWDFLCGELGYTSWQIGLSSADWKALLSATGIDRANVLFVPDGLPAAVSTGWDCRTCLQWARRRGAGR